MAQDLSNKEALFNEVKGSLFEFLVGKEIALQKNEELAYLKSLDKNYLHVLTQQDRMVRQFYPEMGVFLSTNARLMAQELIAYFKVIPNEPKLVGKFTNSPSTQNWHEADLILETPRGETPISLKLNKKNAFVNTKSGGIKSFFIQYFPETGKIEQDKYNKLVDLEFSRMAYELHELHGMEFDGTFTSWVKRGFSELPGELDKDSRGILKSYYARLAKVMHEILSFQYNQHPESFIESLPTLMGFSSKDIIQAICFHDFKAGSDSEIFIHSFDDLKSEWKEVTIMPFEELSSVNIKVGNWALQIRIKPMNKFTTTAMKINCSVRFKQPSGA